MRRASFCGTGRISLRMQSIWREHYCKRVRRKITECMSAAFVVVRLELGLVFRAPC